MASANWLWVMGMSSRFSRASNSSRNAGFHRFGQLAGDDDAGLSDGHLRLLPEH